MPRVTPQHTEARRQQILDAARLCFIRDGFHATSMQDIQRESGLSAGAIYLYFRTKDDIVAAIATGALTAIADVFSSSGASVTAAVRVSLADVLDRVLSVATRLQDEERMFSLIIQVWAEALRNPALHARLIAQVETTKAKLTALLTGFQERGLIDLEADPEALTMAMIGIVQGFIIQNILLEGTTLERYTAGVRALLQSGSGDPT